MGAKVSPCCHCAAAKQNGALFRNPIARNILGQVQNRLDIRALIDNRSIFIARLPKGIVGKNTATLLGALLMTQFQQAASNARTYQRKHVCPFISLLMNPKLSD